MMMIPVHAIVFFLSLVLLPQDVRQFTVDFYGKSMQWTRTAGGWHAVQLPQTEWGTYVRSNTTVTVVSGGREQKTRVTEFLDPTAFTDGATPVEFATLKPAYGSPIQVKREPNRVTLSQATPGLLRGPVVITWPVAP